MALDYGLGLWEVRRLCSLTWDWASNLRALSRWPVQPAWGIAASSRWPWRSAAASRLHGRGPRRRGRSTRRRWRPATGRGGEGSCRPTGCRCNRRAEPASNWKFNSNEITFVHFHSTTKSHNILNFNKEKKLFLLNCKNAQMQFYSRIHGRDLGHRPILLNGLFIKMTKSIHWSTFTEKVN